jgi:hypothetical protein
MLQFYFLSVFLNAAAGYLLISDEEKENFFESFLRNKTFRLVVGVLCVITGFLKLLSPIEGDLPIVGDLFPSLSALTVGFILLFEFYKNHSSPVPEDDGLSEKLPGSEEKLELIIIRHKKAIGFAALTAAALHFIFPQVLLL